MCFRIAVIVCALLVYGETAVRHKSTRIINGEEAASGEFPHMVTVTVGTYHLCGGSIIANGWVVTAAHCVSGQNISSLGVVSDFTDFTNPGLYQWFNVAEVIQHPDFNQGTGSYPNDIALLRLQLDGRDTSANAIAVSDGSQNFVGDACTITGWGVTESGSPSNQLRKAGVTVLEHSDCVLFWGTANLLDQHLCVMGTDSPVGAGACNLDNGGPLVCSNMLAGVISWGSSGCHNDGLVELPTVTAGVGYFYDWISTACGGCV